jgi:hypothetical protein
MQRQGFRPDPILVDGINISDNADRDGIARDAVFRISDPDKMGLFRDELARFIRDDPDFDKGEKISLLEADRSIRGALVSLSIPHSHFLAWTNFLRENTMPPVDQEVRPTLTRQAGQEGQQTLLSGRSRR